MIFDLQFVSPEIGRTIYSLYRDGMSIESINYYMQFVYENSVNLSIEQINAVIDFWNELFV